MRILYVSQYYPPDMGAPSARVSDLAREWSKRGHAVTVLTAFSHHPHGFKRPTDRWRLMRREADGPVAVLRCYVLAAANAGFFWRIASFLSFMFSAMVVGTLFAPRPDVVIATSPQLFTGIAGWWLGRVKRAPFVFEVRDLWPESIVGVGAMRESRVIGWLKRLAGWLYSASDLVVTVGEGYRDRLLAHYPIGRDKIRIVTNGVDLDQFRFRADLRERIRKQLGLEDRFVVLYLGTQGMAHGLESVLDAALLLARADRFHFLFVGDGAEAAALRARTAALGLANVTFEGPCARGETVGYYSAADVCLVPLRKVDLFADVLPSKMFEIMALARPIVLSVAGRAREIVERAGCGVAVPPEDPAALVAALVSLEQDPERAKRLGQAGRRHASRHYCRAKLAALYLEILEEIRGRPRVLAAPLASRRAVGLTSNPTPHVGNQAAG